MYQNQYTRHRSIGSHTVSTDLGEGLYVIFHPEFSKLIVFISVSVTSVWIQYMFIIYYMFYPFGYHQVRTFTVGCTAHPFF
jgi:hypothetical protein